MATTGTAWFDFLGKEDLDSPALVIYYDRVRANIDLAIKMVGDPERLRPHIKTAKSSKVIEMIRSAGIRKFKCATISEAELLAKGKAEDVLLAYQPIGPKLTRFFALIKAYPGTSFSCLVDSADVISKMEETAKAQGLIMSVFLDINLGQNRTGIAPGPLAEALFQRVSKSGNMKIRGLHGYDGHIREANWDERKVACDRAFESLFSLKRRLEASSPVELLLVVGGSPTFSIHCSRPAVECSPGTFVFWDKGYLDLCPEQGFLPAALVMTRVISIPSKDTVCLDLGHKSIAAENPLDRRAFFLNASGLKAVSQSEEHLVLENAGNQSFRVGDILFGMPYHICPTVALYERATWISEGRVLGQWSNEARDRVMDL